MIQGVNQKIKLQDQELKQKLQAIEAVTKPILPSMPSSLVQTKDFDPLTDGGIVGLDGELSSMEDNFQTSATQARQDVKSAMEAAQSEMRPVQDAFVEVPGSVNPFVGGFDTSWQPIPGIPAEDDDSFLQTSAIVKAGGAPAQLRKQ